MIRQLGFLSLFLSSIALAGPSSLIELSASNHRPGSCFIVNKAKRKMDVWTIDNGVPKLSLTTEVDIGKGSGVKLKRGDLKTPEGVYFLIDRKAPPTIPASIYGELAFTTNYPNYFDLLEGKTGDGIWLHAVPDTVSLTRGSKGCVVVRNDVIKNLESFIKLRHTSLVILDDEKEITEEERLALRDKIHKFIADWKSAWESQDMDKFLNFYSERFKGYGMNFKQWAAYKRNLALKNKNTQIEQSDFNILQYNNQFVVLFSQAFQSSAFQDEGDKILYIGAEGENLKVFSEEFLKEDVGLKAKAFTKKD